MRGQDARRVHCLAGITPLRNKRRLPGSFPTDFSCVSQRNSRFFFTLRFFLVIKRSFLRLGSTPSVLPHSSSHFFLNNIICLNFHCSNFSILFRKISVSNVEINGTFKKSFFYCRIYGKKSCSRCEIAIRPTEPVFFAADEVYHVTCFSCETCNRTLQTGQQFGMFGTKVFCRYLETRSAAVKFSRHS